MKASLTSRLPDVNRRDFLRYGASLGAISVAGCETVFKPSKSYNHSFSLIRPEDRLYIEVEARSFDLLRKGKSWRLKPRADLGNYAGPPRLIFRFPPQHFAETTIPVQTVLSNNDSLFDASLDAVKLFPSDQSKLVFNVPSDIEELLLSAESLLDWSSFEYVYPDLDAIGSDDSRRYLLGLQDWSVSDTSVVELPWGIYLQPVEEQKVDVVWRHALAPKARGNASELWITQLESTYGRHYPMLFEVLDLRGIKSSVDAPTIYADEDWYGDLDGIEQTPLRNSNRFDLARSLSRRFPYFSDGSTSTTNLTYRKPKVDANGEIITDDQGSIEYNEFNSIACHVEGRFIEVNTYGISPYGGWLNLRAQWDPKPGCGLQSWTHQTSFGRDHLVKTENKGWLYPFGIPAILTTVSERVFIKDPDGHYVAPLVKQAFIRIPQPNEIVSDHLETPFHSVSIITETTGPLDPPAPAQNNETPDVSQLALWDYFIPQVDGLPVEFELSCRDHDGTEFFTQLPVYFVSNKALNANGLIPEPGYNPAGSGADSGLQVATCGTVMCNSTRANFSAVQSSPDRGGLWDLDAKWLELPYRFAKFDGAKIALSPSGGGEGEATQDVNWVEWVRGEQPPPQDRGGPIPTAAQPFIPRVRTMKIALQTMRQFSGQASFVLTTYRNLQLDCYRVLDPRPTNHAIYSANVFDPVSIDNTSDTYLQVLTLPGIIQATDTNDPNRPRAYQNSRLPVDSGRRLIALNSDSRIEAIKAAYYGRAGINLPNNLFTNLDNEMRFGVESNTEAMGGLTAPDSTIGLVSIKSGPVGDNAFDLAAMESPKHQVRQGRLDCLNWRWDDRYRTDISPYDDLPTGSSLDSCRAEAFSTVGLASDSFVAQNVGSGIPQSPMVGNLASMFGLDAEILPGINLMMVLQSVGIDFGGSDDVSLRTSSDSGTTGPLEWRYQITGLEELMMLIGNGPGQISLPEFLASISKPDVIEEPSRPLEFGVEAGIDWKTRQLSDVDMNIVKFRSENPATGSNRVKSSFGVSATTKLSFTGAKPTIAANAVLDNFTVDVLGGSILIGFQYVRFDIDGTGRKDFTPKIGEVAFGGKLGFINNLKSLLKDLEDALGIKIEITTKKVRISQVIAIPPAKPGGEQPPLVVGPAIIENLSFQWGISIPLLGRDVMVIHFGLASRQDPFTISVPPHGGKAHALMEVTSQGMRLFEVSMEYGGMLKAKYSIAEGELSLTAGIFYKVENTGGDRSFELAAFSKLTGTLDVASVITFHGLIHVVLRDSGNGIKGEVTVKVSVKIGFIRYSYGFTAGHEENPRPAGGGSDQSSLFQEPMFALFDDGGSMLVSTNDGYTSPGQRQPKFCSDLEEYTLADIVTEEQWRNFVRGYAY